MNRSSEKLEKFEALMQQGLVYVRLDARQTGVEVPEHLADDPALTLKLSYAFQGETTHDETAITTYLKFSGQYQRCVLPWSAIWGMNGEDSKQTLWPEDIPKELVFKMLKAELSSIGTRLFGKKEAKTEEGDETVEPEPKKKPKSGHLRRVK